MPLNQSKPSGQTLHLVLQCESKITNIILHLIHNQNNIVQETHTHIEFSHLYTNTVLAIQRVRTYHQGLHNNNKIKIYVPTIDFCVG